MIPKIGHSMTVQKACHAIHGIPQISEKTFYQAYLFLSFPRNSLESFSCVPREFKKYSLLPGNKQYFTRTRPRMYSNFSLNAFNKVFRCFFFN